MLQMTFFQTISLLMIKTSDTNRFIRADSNASLDAASEHMSIAKAVAIISKNGLQESIL
jgi:hypothetical protein